MDCISYLKYRYEDHELRQYLWQDFPGVGFPKATTEKLKGFLLPLSKLRHLDGVSGIYLYCSLGRAAKYIHTLT